MGRRAWGGAGGNQQSLAVVSSSRPEETVQVQPSPTRLSADRLSLGPAGLWKVCGSGWALTSSVALHNSSRPSGSPLCPLQAPRVSVCDPSPVLASSLIPRLLHRLSFLLPNPLPYWTGAPPQPRASLTRLPGVQPAPREPPTPLPIKEPGDATSLQLPPHSPSLAPPR